MVASQDLTTAEGDENDGQTPSTDQRFGLTIDDLTATPGPVIVAFCDMQVRLAGKRISARLFVEDTAADGAECCNYLLSPPRPIALPLCCPIRARAGQLNSVSGLRELALPNAALTP
jgi:hypothetical protein